MATAARSVSTPPPSIWHSLAPSSLNPHLKIHCHHWECGDKTISSCLSTLMLKLQKTNWHSESPGAGMPQESLLHPKINLPRVHLTYILNPGLTWSCSSFKTGHKLHSLSKGLINASPQPQDPSLGPLEHLSPWTTPVSARLKPRGREGGAQAALHTSAGQRNEDLRRRVPAADQPCSRRTGPLPGAWASLPLCVMPLPHTHMHTQPGNVTQAT